MWDLPFNCASLCLQRSKTLQIARINVSHEFSSLSVCVGVSLSLCEPATCVPACSVLFLCLSVHHCTMLSQSFCENCTVTGLAVSVTFWNFISGATDISPSADVFSRRGLCTSRCNKCIGGLLQSGHQKVHSHCTILVLQLKDYPSNHQFKFL